MTEQALTGWGRATHSTPRRTVTADDTDHVAEEVQRAASDPAARGILVRGLGRAYGDAAQNGGGTVLDLTLFDEIGLDSSGIVTAGAGTSLGALGTWLLARGLFLPVTPGTQWVTVGGAVAADVHGKNHHRDGSWGNHVRFLDVVTGTGEQRRLHPDDDDPSAFWATVAGMGLTAVITRVGFQPISAPSSAMVVTTSRHRHLQDVMDRLREGDATSRYSVAWVDSVGLGGTLGRGVVTLGEHAANDTPSATAATPTPVKARIGVPFDVPSTALNSLSIGAFNRLWFARAGLHQGERVEALRSFFYPLDGVDNWNRLYGRRGMIQYQFAVPDDSSAVIGLVLESLRSAGAPSFLTVLKRFGPGNDAPLSFPLPGWTLALDIPAMPRIGPILDALDRAVLEAGGRFYLAKDARMSAAVFAHGYPRLAEWRVTRSALDPHGVFVSDQARRLNLVGA